MKIVPSRGDDYAMELVVQTIALFNNDDEKIIEHLAEYHDRMMTKPFLNAIRINRADKILEAREALAQRKEREAIADLNDNIALANEVVRESLKAQQKRLEQGTVADPSKVARDAADVMAKSVDKSRLLQDKPTTIVVKKTAEEDINTLIRLGVLEEQKQIDDAEVVDD